MANTYYKIKKESFKNDYLKSLNTKFEKEYRESINSNFNDDLYSLVSGLHQKRLSAANTDINTLLKYYIINKLIETSDNTIENRLNNLKPTANANIKKDSEGNYYKLINNEFVHDTSIISVDKEGNYTVHEVREYSPFKIVRQYDKFNQPTMIQIRNLKDKILTDKWQIAEILNFRQEYKTKHKYSGYSGNSNEFVAKLLNKFSKPIPTGYFMDSKFLIWKWNYDKVCFCRAFDREELPLMSDFEFKSDGIVIRQEYTGIKN